MRTLRARLTTFSPLLSPQPPIPCTKILWTMLPPSLRHDLPLHADCWHFRPIEHLALHPAPRMLTKACRSQHWGRRSQR